MANNIIRFRDYTEVEVQPSKEVSDFMSGNHASGATSLTVSVAATHSGRMTRNKALYLPDRMRGSTHTWTAQYPKPILVHHDDINDPIGRAVNADYIDTSTILRDALTNRDPKLIKDSVYDISIFDKFVQGKLPHAQVIDYVNHLLSDSILSDRNNEGLGYINLTMQITDPAAIEKILDGRYLTGSVNATTDSAVCSVCKQDWAGSDGMCEHTPGKEYDDKVCVLIAGDFIYDEYSFVNKPADELSRVIRIGDSVINIDDKDAKTQKSFILLDSVSQEELPMSLKDKLITSLSDHDNPAELADSLIIFATENKLEWNEEKLEDCLTDILKQYEDSKDAVKVFFGDSYDAIVKDDEAGRFYAEIMHSYAVMPNVDADEVKDATLTAAERATLRPVVFAGPFLCQDALHAQIARVAVKTYTGSDKGKVSGIIERKCARLGVDKVEDEFDAEYFDQYEDDRLTLLRDGITAAMKERSLEVTDEAELSDKVNTLTTELGTSKEALQTLQADVENLEDSLADANQKLRDLQLARIKDFKVLANEDFDPTKIEDEFKEKSTEDFETILKDYGTKVDVVQISEKLNSGLANIPNGTVVDPVGKQDANKQLEDKKQIQELILQKYVSLRLQQNGQILADNFLRDYEKRGLVLTDTKKEIEAINDK